MADKAIGKIYETTEYSKFHFITGNRDIDEAKVKEKVREIRRDGYQKTPLMVNEKFEIIEGQHRFMALKELGLPVPYMVNPGADVRVCQILNKNVLPWRQKDTIASQANSGNTNYMYLKILMEEFGGVGIETIMFALHSSMSTIKQETLSVTTEQYNSARKALRFAEEFKPILDRGNKGVKIKHRFYYAALIFCYENEKIDNETLKARMSSNANKITKCATNGEAVAVIDEIYNYRTGRKFNVDIKAEWRAYEADRKRRGAEKARLSKNRRK